MPEKGDNVLIQICINTKLYLLTNVLMGNDAGRAVETLLSLIELKLILIRGRVSA